MQAQTGKGLTLTMLLPLEGRRGGGEGGEGVAGPTRVEAEVVVILSDGYHSSSSLMQLQEKPGP